MIKLPPAYEEYGCRIKIKSQALWMFTACFVVWQMGVIFYSGTTMSLFGRTPFPLVEENTTLLIIFGYVVSIVCISLFPRKMVYVQRILLPLSFFATLLMLLPLPAGVLTLLFYVSAFGCIFSIGGMISVASHLFTLETVWRDAIIGLSTGGVIIAVLQNDFVKVSFTTFTILSLFLTAAMSAFYFLIPARIEIPYANKDSRPQMPKILFFGLLLINAFTTLLLCFASAFAETTQHGLSVIYLSGAVLALVMNAMKKRYKGSSVKLFGIFFMLTVAGFVLAYFSLEIPSLKLPACALLGCGAVLANLCIFFCGAAFNVYPTRFIGAVGAAQGLVLAMVHAGMLEAFRSNTSLLYGIYALLSVAMMLAYYFMEPYFTYSWKAHKEPDAPASPTEKRCASMEQLSEQERILSELILKGYTESFIAREMNITLNTQKSYRKNLYAKLDIHSKRELFELADAGSTKLIRK